MIEPSFQISLLAAGMRKLGVEKGDRVVIYMPLIPEAVMAMLATVRIGAVHSVVFGGEKAKLYFPFNRLLLVSKCYRRTIELERSSEAKRPRFICLSKQTVCIF